MTDLRRYLAEIGRRGGMKSRRVLAPEMARRMVQIREARRVARCAHHGARPVDIPADTSSAAQAIQDALLRCSSPAEKLAQVARLSRMVHQLSMAGLKERHASADMEEIRYRRAESQLGRELAQRIYGARSDVA